MDETDQARVARLCPALRAVVEAEVSAGNRVVETWEGWGFVVMLGSPFVLRHAPGPDALEYRSVNDPHYWHSEWRCGVHDQAVACRFESAVTPRRREIRLEPFDVGRDLALLATWLARPHVSPWWPELDAQLQEARERPAGSGQVLIILDDSPVGYMRWQKADVSALEQIGLNGIPEGSVDMDILLGEPHLVGQGIGRRAIQTLRDKLLEDAGIPLVGMVTSVANEVAIRAIRAAGFAPFGEYVDPRYGRCAVLTCRRSKSSGATAG